MAEVHERRILIETTEDQEKRASAPMLPGFSLSNEEQPLFRKASIIYMIRRDERERRLANGHRTHHHGRYAETSQGGRSTYSVTISHCHTSPSQLDERPGHQKEKSLMCGSTKQNSGKRNGSQPRKRA